MKKLSELWPPSSGGRKARSFCSSTYRAMMSLISVTHHTQLWFFDFWTKTIFKQIWNKPLKHRVIVRSSLVILPPHWTLKMRRRQSWDVNINISKCITTKKRKDNISTNSATAPTDVKLNWSQWALKNTPHCENFNLPRMLHAGWDLSTAHVVRFTFVSPTEQNNRPCIRCHRAVKCSKLHLEWQKKKKIQFTSVSLSLQICLPQQWTQLHAQTTVYGFSTVYM